MVSGVGAQFFDTAGAGGEPPKRPGGGNLGNTGHYVSAVIVLAENSPKCPITLILDCSRGPLPWGLERGPHVGQKRSFGVAFPDGVKGGGAVRLDAAPGFLPPPADAGLPPPMHAVPVPDQLAAIMRGIGNLGEPDPHRPPELGVAEFVRRQRHFQPQQPAELRAGVALVRLAEQPPLGDDSSDSGGSAQTNFSASFNEDDDEVTSRPRC